MAAMAARDGVAEQPSITVTGLGARALKCRREWWWSKRMASSMAMPCLTVLVSETAPYPLATAAAAITAAATSNAPLYIYPFGSGAARSSASAWLWGRSTNEMERRRRVPKFGYWDYREAIDLPVTRCFDAAVHAGSLTRRHSFGDVDGGILRVSAHARFACDHRHHHRRHHRKEKRVPREGDHRYFVKERRGNRSEPKLQPAAATATLRRPGGAPKAVDEDLYKIPAELLYQKPKRKRLLRNLWSGCMGLNS